MLIKQEAIKMFGHIDDSMMEIFDATFEIEAGNKIQRQAMQAPRIFLEQQFMSLVQQAYESHMPVRVKISAIVYYWYQYEQRWIDRENSVEFINKAWQDSH